MIDLRERPPALPVLLACSAALALMARDAHAAPPWVDRHLTLPGGNWAFDFGLGVAHESPGLVPDVTGVGINAEMAVGLTSRVELGVRSGLRLGDGRERATEPDLYGRLFDRQYFDGDGEVVANPEVRVRGALVRESVFELALEGRLIVPVEGNNAGALFGVPMMFHIGNRVRLDTGAYLPVIIGNDRIRTRVDLLLPLDIWIQASPRLWLGPLTGVVFSDLGQPPSRADLSLGFGLGYQITHYLDFKAMLLFPRVTNQDPGPAFGVGAGVEIRIE
jgi:hypothetical protein